MRQGQLLATLDEVSMQNTYQAAKAALKQAEDTYQRMKELHEKGSLAEMKWVEVQSKLQQAQSMEAVARKNLTDCQLYAPFSGVIAEKSLEVGQNVVPGVFTAFVSYHGLRFDVSSAKPVNAASPVKKLFSATKVFTFSV